MFTGHDPEASGIPMSPRLLSRNTERPRGPQEALVPADRRMSSFRNVGHDLSFLGAQQEREAGPTGPQRCVLLLGPTDIPMGTTDKEPGDSDRPSSSRALRQPGPAACWPVTSLARSTFSQLGGHCAAKVKEGGPGQGEGPADRMWPTGPGHCPLLGGGPDGQWVSFGVEHIGVQAE